jgi:hypothetical protein
MDGCEGGAGKQGQGGGTGQPVQLAWEDRLLGLLPANPHPRADVAADLACRWHQRPFACSSGAGIMLPKGTRADCGIN